MIYSRFLHTEVQQPPNEYGEGAYAVFSTQQPCAIHFNLMDEICIQTFAVLWGESTDGRLIHLIEKAIVRSVLSPVKLLHASEGTVMVVHDSRMSGSALTDLDEMWQEVCSEVHYGEWTVEIISEVDVGMLSKGGRVLRKYGPGILIQYELGITEFTFDASVC